MLLFSLLSATRLALWRRRRRCRWVACCGGTCEQWRSQSETDRATPNFVASTGTPWPFFSLWLKRSLPGAAACAHCRTWVVTIRYLSWTRRLTRVSILPQDGIKW